MKLLMALLDQEALAPPCPNQADLLSEDQPLLGGDEANGLLALFRFVENAHSSGTNVGVCQSQPRQSSTSKRDVTNPR